MPLSTLEIVRGGSGADAIARAKADAAQAAIDAHEIAVDPHADRAYTDDEIAALPEPADGIGSSANTSVPGFLSYDNIVRAASAAPTPPSNTTAETSLLAATLDFAGGAIVVDQQVFRVEAGGSFTNNAGGTRDLTLRVKAQGNTILAFAFSAVAASASTRSWRISGTFAFRTFSGVRSFGFATAELGAAGTGVNLGAVTKFAELAPTYTLASTMNFDITAQMSATASPNLSTSLSGYQLLRLRSQA